MLNSDRKILAIRRFPSGEATAWHSETPNDPDWDGFLQSAPVGQFQQSSIWARIKAREGWRFYRVVVCQDASIVGGFQVLFRKRGLFLEGFLNKGPVCAGPDEPLRNWLLQLVEQTAKERGLGMLLAQPPDFDANLDRLLRSRGYANNVLANVISATLCVPLGPPHTPAEGRMRKTIRTEARQALRRGVTVREGSSVDIPTFFELMRTTCLRQKTAPNPASVEALAHLWDGFNEQGLVRLTIAECDGKPTAGVLAIKFGNRVTQWKKGWNEEHREKHPNTLLTLESVQWAEQRGASLYDFVGCDRRSAEALLRGKPNEQVLGSRYFFLLGFGAQPMLLPRSQLWFPSAVVRALYRSGLPLLAKYRGVEG